MTGKACVLAQPTTIVPLHAGMAILQRHGTLVS